MANEMLSLDVADPRKVVDILRAAAQAYRESQAECQTNWQDKSAGWEWPIIARKLEDAANRIEKALNKRG